MPAEQQSKRQAEPEKQDRQRLDAVIGKHVLQTLGQPGNLHRVQVRRLWEAHYRVNVLVGPDAASARVANSYFLVVDGDGTIVASTPLLSRQYAPAFEVPSAG
jgi:hypothetical protein